MANVSSSNGLEKYPKLRFKGFSEPWEHIKLSDFVSRVTRKNSDNQTDIPLTISSKDGLINQNEFFSKQVASKDMSGYYLLQRGEFAYNKSYSVGFDFGSIKRLEKYEQGALSTLYICFTLNRFDSDFIKHYFDSLKWYREIYMISAEGARNHGLLNVPTEDFFATLHSLPMDAAEQRKIAEFLDILTTRIEKQQALVDNLKKYKRGVITSILKQKIRFNSGVEKYPEWSTIRLDELGFFFGGLSGKTKDDFEHGDGKFITYLNVFRNTFALEKGVTLVDVKPNEKQNVIQYGDILFTQSSETVEEVGMSSVWLHQSTPYLNSFCMALRPYSLEYINPKYIGYVLRSEQVRLQIMKEGQGISRINLASSRIGGVTLPMPCLEEQNSIVKFVDGIEATEAFHSQLLLQMQSLKSSLLQKLFI